MKTLKIRAELGEKGGDGEHSKGDGAWEVEYAVDAETFNGRDDMERLMMPAASQLLDAVQRALGVEPGIVRRGHDPQDPPSPEEDPGGYASYLRHRVVAALRRYLVDHGERGLEQQHSYFASASDLVTMEDVAGALRELDAWKREFQLKEVD